MSIIPKISVGQNKRRNKLSLNQDCSTTANVGQIQPTYSKELIPNETIKLSVNSFVRLSPLAVPTFGRMSLRHYHFFVPYMKIWDRFNAFLSQMTVNTPDGNKVPNVPFFNTEDISKLIWNYCDVTLYKRVPTNNRADSLSSQYQILSVSDSVFDSALVDFLDSEKFDLGSEGHFSDSTFDAPSLQPDAAGVIVQDEDILLPDGTHRLPTNIPIISNRTSDGTTFYPVVDFQGCDFSIRFGTLSNNERPYVALFRLKPIGKRLRQLFIGLGYSFTPFFDTVVKFNPFKLIATYMAYFAIFAPKREVGFETTNCYALMQYMHDLTYMSGDFSTDVRFYAFMRELAHMAYYLPMDYFSASTQFAGQTFSPNPEHLRSEVSLDGDSEYAAMQRGSDRSSVYFDSDNGYNSPIQLDLAHRLLTWVNKSTIVGRSISDFIKAHFGVEAPDVTEINGVQYVGSSRVNIQINDIMSTAETSEGFLGEYAGRGIGVDNSKQFEYTAKEFGVFLTLSCIVPESGYVQGYLKENRQLNRFDFPTPEFDALGYELVERGEIMDSYASDIAPALIEPSYQTYKRTQGFGFIPRYSAHKVGRNILNGDLSLPSLFNSMGNYTLDRIFPFAPNYAANTYYGYQNNYMPDIVHDDFRKVTLSDKFGNYNRIFNYTGVDVDHFIIHNVFYVDVLSPLKSLSSSFDTFTDGDDTDVSMKKQ